jgi:hypothetical protein
MVSKEELNDAISALDGQVKVLHSEPKKFFSSEIPSHKVNMEALD